MTLEETLKKIDEDLPQEISNDEAKKKCLTAIEQLDALAKTHNKNAQICNLRGKIYIKLQRLSNAESELKQALDLCDATDPEVLFQYGHLLNLTKKFKDAITYFNQCISLSNGNHPKAHNNLCVSYGFLKDHDKALKHIHLAIQQNPNNALFYSNRALVYYRKIRPDTSLKDKIVAYQQMVQDLDKAILLDPTVDKYVKNRNDFAKKLENVEKELKDKMNAPLDLHLSCSEESTPQPDSVSPASEYIPPPAPVQVNQYKRRTATHNFFTHSQDTASSETSKRKKPMLDSAPSGASPIILPSVTIPDTINVNEPVAHPWQSLPPTPTPPDKTSPSPKLG